MNKACRSLTPRNLRFSGPPEYLCELPTLIVSLLDSWYGSPCIVCRGFTTRGTYTLGRGTTQLNSSISPARHSCIYSPPCREEAFVSLFHAPLMWWPSSRYPPTSFYFKDGNIQYDLAHTSTRYHVALHVPNANFTYHYKTVETFEGFNGKFTILRQISASHTLMRSFNISFVSNRYQHLSKKFTGLLNTFYSWYSHSMYDTNIG